MFIYVDVLFSQNIGVRLLDIGAWVGDVAIRLAKFAKFRNARFHAECYDPSYAGTIIPFNIELNGVDGFVVYNPTGVSLVGGPQIFCQVRGHSDSARLQSIGNSEQGADNYLIRTVTLSACLPPPDEHTHLIVKIDVEGIDAQLVRQNLDQLADATLIVEFAPDQEQYRKDSAAEFIRSLQITHTLFDIYYLPRPTMACLVGDPQQFAEKIRRRPYGYTDVLAIPLSLPAHDELKLCLSSLASIQAAYRMA
jgi:FkbM family methyltransferase